MFVIENLLKENGTCEKSINGTTILLVFVRKNVELVMHAHGLGHATHPQIQARTYIVFNRHVVVFGNLGVKIIKQQPVVLIMMGIVKAGIVIVC